MRWCCGSAEGEFELALRDRSVVAAERQDVVAALDEDQSEVFGGECRARYDEAYPPEPDGVTVVPFSRLFIVARSAD